MALDKTELIHEFIKAFNDRDLVRMHELTDPEYQFNARLAAVEGRIYRGRSGVAELLEDFTNAFADFRAETGEIIDAGSNRVVFLLDISLVSKEAQVPVRQHYAHFWRIRDGRLWLGESYLSRDEALEAAGVETPPADR